MQRIKVFTNYLCKLKNTKQHNPVMSYTFAKNGIIKKILNKIKLPHYSQSKGYPYKITTIKGEQRKCKKKNKKYSCYIKLFGLDLHGSYQWQ